MTLPGTMQILINQNSYHLPITRAYKTGLKVGRMTRTIWVTWVTFGGSSGSHPQTKLSGFDPDITCSLENSVGIW